MTDRELLEMAAKAAGKANGTWFDGWSDDGRETGTFWNPLTDDGDALRLAVKLGIAVYPPEDPMDDATVHVDGEESHWISEPALDGDPYAATRRAIVRAAAEIGRAM